MVEIAPGWKLDIWPANGWVCARIVNPHPDVQDAPALAEELWTAMQQHSSLRLVIDFADVPLLYSHLIGQLVLLHKRLRVSGGTIRLCGLSEGNREVLRVCRLDGLFQQYADLAAALDVAAR